MSARRVLLTVSGTIDPDVAEQVRDGRRPRPDYVELAAAMDADLLDVPEARRQTGRFGRLLERVGGRAALLAWACFRARKRYDAIVTDGEQVGLPLALLWRFTRRGACAHVMIVHILSVPKKVILYRAFGLGRRIDTMLVYSSWQQEFIRKELRFPADAVVLTTFMVDTRFFAPEQAKGDGGRMLCTAGLELRDYPTLIEAVRGVEARVVVAAASHWSKRADNSQDVALPPNVETTSLGYVDLRQLYADARFVVMPLQETEFQAGVTTLLEAMAMGKAVVCSRTKGQTDVVVEGENGLYVPPGDVAALRAAIERLLADEALAERLGASGRAYVERECEVTRYAERIAADVEGAIARRSAA